MKYEPWARLTTRITPKMSESPLASRNRSAPYDRPLKVWVTQNSAVTGARPHSQAEQTPRACDCRILGHPRSEEHTSELQSRPHLVCRLLLEKKKNLIIK